MKLKNFLKQIILPSFLVFFIACSDSSSNNTATNNDTTAKTDENPKKAAEDSNDAKMSGKAEDNAQYLVDAYSGSLYEVKASEGAQKMSGNAEVKSLAAKMVAAHTKMNGMIKDLAAKKQVSLPADLTDKQKDKMAECSKKTGNDFNKAYLDDLEGGHKDMIDLLQKASDNSNDADIKSWAATALPEVKGHLDMVKTLQDKIKK